MRLQRGRGPQDQFRAVHQEDRDIEIGELLADQGNGLVQQLIQLEDGGGPLSDAGDQLQPARPFPQLLRGPGQRVEKLAAQGRVAQQGQGRGVGQRKHGEGRLHQAPGKQTSQEDQGARGHQWRIGAPAMRHEQDQGPDQVQHRQQPRGVRQRGYREQGGAVGRQVGGSQETVAEQRHRQRRHSRQTGQDGQVSGPRAGLNVAYGEGQHRGPQQAEGQHAQLPPQARVAEAQPQRELQGQGDHRPESHQGAEHGEADGEQPPGAGAEGCNQQARPDQRTETERRHVEPEQGWHAAPFYTNPGSFSNGPGFFLPPDCACTRVRRLLFSSHGKLLPR